MITIKQTIAATKKVNTGIDRLPDGTLYSKCSPYLALKYVVAKHQGRPSPKKTLTELDPVTFPIAESALCDSRAAVILARVSGSDVPNATSVTPVIDSGILNTHPNAVAKSLIRITTRPIHVRETRKHG